MRNVTLRQMKVFATVARHLSFTRAARELHLTQPAVSQQVKLLEQEAGLPLFEKIGRRVQLAPAGEELLRYANQAIELLREATESLAAMRGLKRGVQETDEAAAPAGARLPGEGPDADLSRSGSW